MTTSLGQVLHLVRANLIRGSFFEVVRWIPIAVLSGLNLWTGMQAHLWADIGRTWVPQVDYDCS